MTPHRISRPAAAPPRISRTGLIVTVLGLALSACASVPPPTAQMALSTAAVGDAATAGGTEYAPVEMRSAREKLDRANLAMGAKDYDRARSLAQESQVDAQLAGSKARSMKARKAADELQEDGRVLRQEIDRKAN